MRFGRYTLLRPIAKGGMAEIWKARVDGPEGFAKVLAVKKVLPDLADDPSFVEMFIEEAKLVAKLVHPNVVQVFDFGRVAREYYLAMEYVEGVSLARVQARLAESGIRLPAELAFYIAFEACRGLGYAHAKTDEQGNPLAIVHRDVSPQNILLSYGGEVKVTDFGIAKAATAISRTAEGHVRGKLAYMAPEQVSLQPLDGRTDLFALGVVLHELLTGKRLYGRGAPEELYARVIAYNGLDERDLAGLPQEARNVLLLALQADPDARFQDATQMETALGGVIGVSGITQSRQILSSMLRKLFLEEIAAEHTPTPFEPMAVGAGGAQMLATGPVPDVTEQKSPSGLSLTVDTGRNLRFVQGTTAPPREAGTGGRGRLVIGGVALAGVVATVFAAADPLGLFHSSAPLATPAPTPAVAATSTPAPIASAAETAVAATRPIASAIEAAVPSPTRRIAEARPTPVRTAVPRVTREAVAPTPAPTPAVTATGTLAVTAKPWVEVWVDGAKVSADTPYSGKLRAGPHKLKFVHLNFTAERTVDVKANATTTIFVDTVAKTVEVR